VNTSGIIVRSRRQSSGEDLDDDRPHLVAPGPAAGGKM
ncbi:MAG: hypothetical protein, partial [Olavius algarvensis Delta 4 endosymbiont]